MSKLVKRSKRHRTSKRKSRIHRHSSSKSCRSHSHSHSNRSKNFRGKKRMTRKLTRGGHVEQTTNGTQNAFIRTNKPIGYSSTFSFTAHGVGYFVTVKEDDSRLGGYTVDGDYTAVQEFLAAANEKQAWEKYGFSKT